MHWAQMQSGSSSRSRASAERGQRSGEVSTRICTSSDLQHDDIAVDEGGADETVAEASETRDAAASIQRDRLASDEREERALRQRAARLRTVEGRSRCVAVIRATVVRSSVAVSRSVRSQGRSSAHLVVCPVSLRPVPSQLRHFPFAFLRCHRVVPRPACANRFGQRMTIQRHTSPHQQCACKQHKKNVEIRELSIRMFQPHHRCSVAPLC